MDFAEGSNMRLQGNSGVPRGAFLLCFSRIILSYKEDLKAGCGWLPGLWAGEIFGAERSEDFLMGPTFPRF